VVTTVSLDKDKGVDILKKALAAIKEIITQKKGSLSVKMEPRAVTATDEAQLATMMEKYEKENTEVAGDEGDGDGDGGDAEGQGESRTSSPRPVHSYSPIRSLLKLPLPVATATEIDTT